MDSHLSTAPAAPDIITSPSQRTKAGVGLMYVDDYNANLQNQYNNAYNYWLWQQQMEYNSPKNQVQRLLDAGLNPNYNAIDGAGNAGAIPSSSAQLPGNIGRNHLNAITTAVGVASGLAGAAAKGVQALKTFATTPKAIGFYRGILRDIAGEKFEGSRFDNYLKEIELARQSKLYGVTDHQFGSIEPGSLNNDAPYWAKVHGENSLLDARNTYQRLMNDLRDWENKTYNPIRLEKTKADIDYLLAGVGLRNLELKWKNPKEAFGILATLLPLIGRFAFK